MTIAILAGLGGMFGWGAADFFAKKTIDEIGPIKSLVWGHGFGAFLFIALTLSDSLVQRQAVPVPHQASTWLGLAGFGLLQMVVYWLVYQGFEKGQLAVLNPVFASFSGLVALISIIFLGESATGPLLAALAILFVGIIILNVDIEGLRSKRLKVAPGLKEVGLATVLAAAWTVGWDKFASGQPSLPYSAYMYVFMTLAAYILAKVMKEQLTGVKPALWKFLALIGVGETLAYLSITWGYGSTTLTSIVALISGAFSVPTVILAYLFLKERVSRLQAAGIGLTIIGVVLVALT